MSEELRMLRARAFGQSPDIEDDPAALRRLAELEDLARGAVSPPEPDPVGQGAGSAPTISRSPATSAPTVISAPPADSAAVAATDDASSPSTVTIAPARLSRRTRGLWIASLAGTAMVTLGLTLLAVSTGSAGSLASNADVTQIGTVEPDTYAEWPSFFGNRAEDSVVYADFYGLTALRQSGGAIGRDGMDCVAVFLTTSVRSADDYYSGPSFFGCGAGALPARVPVLVDSSMPTELLARFPLGSALEFVVDGDRLTVFAAEAPTVTTAP